MQGSQKRTTGVNEDNCSDFSRKLFEHMNDDGAASSQVDLKSKSPAGEATVADNRGLSIDQV